jgi:head-tail adaptor
MDGTRGYRGDGVGVFESLLNHDYSVYRRMRLADHQGGWQLLYTDTGLVKGRLRPATSQEREVAALEERRISHVFYCDAEEDIVRGDSLIGDGVVVNVVGVREPSRAGHHLEIDCLERQAESVETGS